MRDLTPVCWVRFRRALRSGFLFYGGLLRLLPRPRYLLAIAALAFLYSLSQAARHAFRMRGGVDPVSAPSGRLLDFVGDQASDCFQLLVC